MLANSPLHDATVDVFSQFGQKHCKADDSHTPNILNDVHERSGIDLNGGLSGGENDVETC